MEHNPSSFILSLEEYAESPDNHAIVMLDDGDFTSVDVLYASFTGFAFEPTLPMALPQMIDEELTTDMSDLDSLRVKRALRMISKKLDMCDRRNFAKEISKTFLALSEDELY